MLDKFVREYFLMMSILLFWKNFNVRFLQSKYESEKKHFSIVHSILFYFLMPFDELNLNYYKNWFN